MDCNSTHVSPGDIDRSDHTFKITTASETADLVRSISAIGLLQPPMVTEANDRLVIVCGFRRLAAMAAMNEEKPIPVRRLSSSTPKRVLSSIAISDNTFQRQLNVVEQARSYALIRDLCGPADDWRQVAEACGLPGSGKAMDRILPIVDMPEVLQQAIVDGSIALPVAHQINALADEDRDAVIMLMRQLTTGLNVQRELLELLTEIGRRDAMTIRSLLTRPRVAEILDNDQTATPQKVQQFRGLLKTLRFPTLSRVEQNYRQALKALHLSPRIQIQPPPFFEGKSYRVTLTVDSRQQLKSLQHALEQLIATPDILPE